MIHVRCWDATSEEIWPVSQIISARAGKVRDLLTQSAERYYALYHINIVLTQAIANCHFVI